MNINDITKQLARKYSGDMLKPLAKPEPPAPARTYQEPRSYSTGVSTGGEQHSFAQGKLFPSERAALGSATKPIPRRPMVLMSTFPLDDLEFMAGITVKRNWTWEAYLEVMDMPLDLHPKHDTSMYEYLSRLFILGKRKAHQN